MRIGRRAVKQPVITKVCRQIRQESLSLYYGSHNFVVAIVLEDHVAANFVPNGSLEMFLRWLYKLNKRAHSAIKTLTMDIYASVLYPTPAGLSAFEDWQKLALRLRRLGYRQPRLRIHAKVKSYILTNESVALRAVGMRNQLESIGLVLDSVAWEMQ